MIEKLTPQGKASKFLVLLWPVRSQTRTINIIITIYNCSKVFHLSNIIVCGPLRLTNVRQYLVS